MPAGETSYYKTVSDIGGSAQGVLQGDRFCINRDYNYGLNAPGRSFLMMVANKKAYIKSAIKLTEKNGSVPVLSERAGEEGVTLFGNYVVVGGPNQVFRASDMARLNREKQEECVRFLQGYQHLEGDAALYGLPYIPTGIELTEADFDRIIAAMAAPTSPLFVRYLLFECVGFDEVKLVKWEAAREARLGYTSETWPKYTKEEKGEFSIYTHLSRALLIAHSPVVVPSQTPLSIRDGRRAEQPTRESKTL